MQKPFEFDQALENTFVQLISDSWRRYDDIERNSWIDDALIGGLVTAHLDHDLFLLTTISDGSSHYLLFSTEQRDRYIVRLDHRYGEDYLFSKTIGHLASLEIGVGRAYPNLQKLWKATKSEWKSNLATDAQVAGFADPGVMKIDAEGSIATCTTTLLIDVADYVDKDSLEVDTEKLWAHLGATYQSLEKYLSGIMA